MRSIIAKTVALTLSRLLKLVLLVLLVVLVSTSKVSAARHAISDLAGNISYIKQGLPDQVLRNNRKNLYQPGEVLVRFKPTTTETAKQYKHGRLNAEVIRNHKQLRMHHVRLKKGTVEDAVAQYMSDPGVEYAEPNYLVSAQNTPNDPQFSQQWGLGRINAPSAWSLTTGNSDVVVAILDTGIDYTHPDLIGNLWINQSELNGLPGSDDDGNSYTDDIYGFNAVNNTGDPRDDHYHGTHVAGIIGAVGNNATGVSGVAWNVKLMACKFLAAGGSGTIGDAIECFQYVKTMKNRGVNIVATNNSWGTPSYSQALYDAIHDQQDILFVAAAGNDNSKTPLYPAGYDLPNVISVAASDAIDLKASYSDFNKWSVDIAAPGSNILSAFPGGNYTNLSGTSMAAPHVSGLAALLSSQDSTRKASVLKNLVLAGGDPLSSFTDLTVTGRRINAYNSLTCANSPLFAVLHPPQSPQIGIPQTISAMSINCGVAAGPVSVTLSGGQTIQLHDDGVTPDLVAEDGIFTGTWTPAGSTVEALTFTSPLGTSSVSSPPVIMGDVPTVLYTSMLLPNSVTSANINTPFSQSFPISGGIPPYSWSLIKGSLPANVTLNTSSGEMAGTPAASGIFAITLQVSDALGVKDRKDWTLVLNDGLRSAWPRELQQRAGTGFLHESYSPIIADLDGDGKDEIIVGDVNTLYVFYPDNTSRKTVLPGKVTTPVVADLDGDGHKEIIVSVRENFSNSNSIYAFHSDLSPVTGFPAGAYATVNGGPGFVSSPVVADFDNDGQLKIAVVASPNNLNDQNYDKNVVIMVDGQGQMVSGWPQVFGNNNDDDSPPAVGDIDHDGKLELVFATLDGFVRIFRLDGVMLAQWQYDQPARAAWSPVLADMDGDGYLDVVIKYHSAAAQNVITVLNRNGNPLTGWPKVMSGNGSATPFGPIVADIDGDGHPEIIAVTGSIWNELHALRGDGSSLPNWPVLIPTGISGMPIFNCYPIVADINGDGMQEVLITTVDFSNNGQLLAYNAGGTSVPGFPKYASTSSDIRSTAAIGDVDGNGKLDLVVKSENGFLHAWEMSQDGGGFARQWPMFRNDAQHSGTWVPNHLNLPPVYTLIYSKTGTGNGTVTSSTGTSYSGSGNESIPSGSVVTLTSAPAMDSLFSGWAGCDTVTDNVCSLVMSSNRSITGSFAIKTFIITATAGTNGSIAGPTTITYGGSATYSVTPASGYKVANVLVDGISVGALTTYTFTNVKTNHTISVTFVALADLGITSVNSPNSASRGKSIKVNAAINNKGGGNAGGFTVAFYLSSDTGISNSDTLLGTKTVTALNAGSTSTVTSSFTVPKSIPSGRYYVGAIVDSTFVVAESNESNNSKAAGSTVTIK